MAAVVAGAAPPLSSVLPGKSAVIFSAIATPLVIRAKALVQ